MKRPVLVGIAGLAVMFLAACSSPQPPAQSQPSSPPLTVASLEVTAGVVLEIRIPAAELPANTEQTATVTLTNTSTAKTIVRDIWGLRVLDENGAVIADPAAGAIYPTVTIGLAAGESKVKAIRFDVPGPGSYQVQAYLADTRGGTPPLKFTSVAP